MQAFLSLAVLPPLADVVVCFWSLSYRRISRPARPTWPCTRCPRARPWSRRCRLSHALADARGGGFRALLAGDELLLVTAHVVDELGEKDGGDGGERGSERESSREKNAAEKQGCQT